jgi:hypothetical protein
MRPLVMLVTLTGSAFSLSAADLHLVHRWDPLSSTVLTRGDFDGDGREELVIGSTSRREAVVVELTGSPSSYRVRQRYRLNPPSAGPASDHLTTSKLLDVDQDGVDELCLIWGNRHLMIVDPATGAVINEAQIPTSADIGIGDIDGNGSQELVTVWGGTLTMLDPVSLKPVGNAFFPHPGASRLAIGNLIGDARDEVILSNGWILQISANAGTYTLAASQSFGDEDTTFMQILDLDGDGHRELVAAGLYAGLVVHRFHPAPAQDILVEPDYLSHAEWIDVNEDGIVDAIVALASNQTRAIDLTNGETLWTDIRPNGSDLASAGRFGPDPEVLLAYTEGQSLVFRSLPPESEEMMRTAPERFPASVAAARGPDGKHRLWALSALVNSAYLDAWSSPGFDDATATVHVRDPAPATWPYQDVFNSIASAPAGNAGEALVVSGGRTSADSLDAEGKLWFLDNTGSMTRAITVSGNFVLTQVASADVLPPSGEEVVAIARSEADQTESVAVIDPANGSVLWRSTPAALQPERGGGFAIGDLNDDGSTDVAFRLGDDVHVFTPQQGTAALATYENVANMSTLSGGGAAGAAQLVLGHLDGSVSRYESLAPSPTETIAGVVAYGSIAAFRQAPDGAPLIAINSTYSLDVYAFDSPTPLFTSSTSPGGVELLSIDHDDDNQTELHVFGGGLSVFRVPNDYVHAGGFELPGD